MLFANADHDLCSAQRLDRGLVIILPGIEGYSIWNRSIRRGLASAGVPYAIEIHDWTRGPRWYFCNLRDRRWHRRQAEIIGRKIADYQGRFPGRPVYLVGHSGGGAITAYTLERLPEGTTVTAGIILVGALSPDFDLRPARKGTERGVWSYSAPGDLFFVGIGTVVFGTCDGRHCPGSGLLGFRQNPSGRMNTEEVPPLHQIWFRPRMILDFNLGGHLSCVNPRFIRRWIAPIVLGKDAGPADREITERRAARGPSRTAGSRPAAPRPAR